MKSRSGTHVATKATYNGQLIEFHFQILPLIGLKFQNFSNLMIFQMNGPWGTLHIAGTSL